MTGDRVRVRFAPSPTGYFHLGSARTALYNWLYARHMGGAFVLRIEDTDRTRYDPEALPDLLDAMRWLGICWDEGPEVGGDYGPYFQSDRLHLYQEAVQTLVREGHAYPCYCTPERLQGIREAQRIAGLPPGYDRHCRILTHQQIADYEAQGLRPVYRLAIPTEGETSFSDALRGHIVVDNRQLDDLILLKSDGFPTYHLGVVVDDHHMAITHILRGDEWLASVPKHILLYDAFGWEVPVLVHLPTILDPSGKGKLSKRKKKLADGRELLTLIREFRQAGYLPEALVNMLALVGWSYDDHTEYFTRSELVRLFSLERVSASPAAFSYDKLAYMNATYSRGLGTNDLAGRILRVLLDAGLPADIHLALKIVPLVRERMRTLQDAPGLVDFAFVSDLTYDPELLVQKKMDASGTRQALGAARAALEGLQRWDEPALEERLRALANELGIKPGMLFGTIRVAVTGREVAPPLFGTLDLLGREVALRRLGSAEALLDGRG